MLAFRLYDAVTAVHVMAVVVAFGVTFAYPLAGPYVLREHPRFVPAFHRVQVLIGRRLITPAATVALLAGIWLAVDADVFGEAWVQIPFGILILLLGMVGAFFTPRETRLAELADRDLAAGDELSQEYRDAVKAVAIGGSIAAVLVLVAIFVMVTKWPG